jgi:hypothetical protein
VKIAGHRKVDHYQCSSVSLAGRTRHFALLRTNRKQRGTMSENHTHPPIREINVRTPILQSFGEPQLLCKGLDDYMEVKLIAA